MFCTVFNLYLNPHHLHFRNLVSANLDHDEIIYHHCLHRRDYLHHHDDFDPQVLSESLLSCQDLRRSAFSSEDYWYDHDGFLTWYDDYDGHCVTVIFLFKCIYQIIFPLIYVLIVYFMTAQPLDPARYLTSFFIITIVSSRPDPRILITIILFTFDTIFLIIGDLLTFRFFMFLLVAIVIILSSSSTLPSPYIWSDYHHHHNHDQHLQILHVPLGGDRDEPCRSKPRTSHWGRS